MADPTKPVQHRTWWRFSTMAMNPNVGMANMNPMGGAVGGAPMPMMNNGVVNPQAAAAANASGAGRQQASEQHRLSLNTYIYEYFLRQGLYDCARAMVDSEVPLAVSKDERRRDDNGNVVNGTGDSMDTDSKDDFDRKIPEDLPTPNLAMSPTDSSFLFEWFSLFWDIFHAQRNKGSNGSINQYVQHTQVSTWSNNVFEGRGCSESVYTARRQTPLCISFLYVRH